MEIQNPLIKLIDKKLVDIKTMFKNYTVEGLYNQQTLQWNMHEFDLNTRLSLEENVWMLGFQFALQTFIPGSGSA